MTLSSRFALAVVLAHVLAAPAAAHSKMDGTTPADGSVVTAAPEEITMHFAKKIRLTKMTMTRGADAPVDIDLSAAGPFGNMFTVPFPAAGNGAYKLEWRGLGADGHALQGEFSFEVAE